MAIPTDPDEISQWIYEINQDIQSAPDDATRAELEGYREQLRAAATQAYQKMNAQEEAGKGVINDLRVGIGSGMNRVAQDVASIPSWMGSHFATGETPFDRRRAAVEQERALMDPLKNMSRAARIGETVGEMAATLPLGGFSGVTAKGLGAGGRIAANAALGAGQSALGSDDPLAAAAMGGLGTGLFSGVGEGWRALSHSRSPRPNVGVDLLPADTSPAAAQAEGAARASLFGGGQIAKARRVQEQQIEQALGGLADRNPVVGADVLGSMREQMMNRKQMAGRLYDDVEAATAGATVDAQAQSWRTEATQAVLDELRKPEGRQDTALINKLRAYLEEPDVDADWGSLRKLRSELKADIRDSYKGTSQIGSRGVGILERTKNALDTDLNAAIPPQAQDAWKTADRFYRENVAQPYGRKGASVVRQMLGKETGDQVTASIMNPAVANNPELIGKIAGGLTPEGQRQIAGELVAALRTAATKPDGTVDPHAAAAFIRDRQAAFRHFLPQEKAGALADTLGMVSAGSAGTLPTAGLRVAAAGVPLTAGLIGAASVPGSQGNGPLDINRAATGLAWGGGALGLEAMMAGAASAMATGRPGPALNAILRSAVTTTSRLQDTEEEKQQRQASGMRGY